MKTKTVLRTLGAAALVAISGAAANAGVSQLAFKTGDSLENTGVTFAGTLSYDDVSHILTVGLSNTSSFQSVITGFYFNVDGNAAASYSATNNATTSGVDEGSFAFGNSLPPFGTFDAGAKLANLSQQQVRGIDEGETGTFTFNLSGPDAGTLDATSFFTDINSGGGLGGAFAVRYQSVGDNAALSDKVMGIIDIPVEDPPPPNAVPLPPAAWAALVTMGVTGLNALRRRRH